MNNGVCMVSSMNQKWSPAPTYLDIGTLCLSTIGKAAYHVSAWWSTTTWGLDRSWVSEIDILEKVDWPWMCHSLDTYHVISHPVISFLGHSSEMCVQHSVMIWRQEYSCYWKKIYVDMLQHTWQDLDYHLDVSNFVTLRKKTCMFVSKFSLNGNSML